MRKYISYHKNGNQLPLYMEIDFLKALGNKLPTNNISMNSYKRITNIWKRVFENTRVAVNLSIAVNSLNQRLLLIFTLKRNNNALLFEANSNIYIGI